MTWGDAGEVLKSAWKLECLRPRFGMMENFITHDGRKDLPPPPGSRWTAPLMILCGLVGFALVAADVVGNGRLHRWDQPLHVWIYNCASASADHPGELPWGVLIFSAISGLGELMFIVAIAVAAGGFFILRRRWRALAVWTVALCGSGIINPALKNWFRLPRPQSHTFFSFGPPPGSGWTFPSGHTMAVTITAGTLAIIMMHLVAMSAAWRRLIVSAAVALSLLEGVALMYVGVHYLTDVLGALFASLAWLGVVRWMLPRKTRRSQKEELLDSSD
jgi:undecaprenyl-diphosphatase